MASIEGSLYSLKKKFLEEIILNYAKEYSNKKIRLSGKNKPDLVDIIIRYNIEVDCKKYLPNLQLTGQVIAMYLLIMILRSSLLSLLAGLLCEGVLKRTSSV